MAIVKKTYKRRRTVRARRMNISKPSAYMKRRSVASLSVNRTQYTDARKWTFSTATTAGFWRYHQFTTADIQDFAALAAVFDEYKICAIKQTWRPRYDSVQAPQAAGTVAQPQAYAHIVVDPASISNPSGVYGSGTLNGFLEQGKLRTVTINKPFSVYFRPQIDTNVLGGLTRGAPKWCKTSDATVPHYGYHMYLQQNNFDTSNTNIILDSFVTVYAKFRNLK